MYSSGCSSYSSGCCGYSAARGYMTQTPSNSIDSVVADYSISTLEHNISDAKSESQQQVVEKQSYSSPRFNYANNLTNYLQHRAPKQYHAVDSFLQLYRPETQFIETSEEVQEHIKESFRLTTGKELPKNIVITVVDKEELRRIHESNNGQWSEGIQGFAMQSPQRKIKQIFVKKNDLDRLMLVIGHEIGHVLTPCLMSKHDEEAKAFAFELAWMKTIVDNNIANLKENINLDFAPANNGLHNVAFNFVRKIVKQGKDALDVYRKIVERVLKVNPMLIE